MASDPLSSSEAFIRALRAPSDPPSAHGLTKIEIASQVWELESLYVPSKGELIAEWILTRFLKEKGKDTQSNPILDVRYWILLSHILEAEVISPPGGSTSHKLKTIWLTPLLGRIPIFPILAVVIRSLPRVPDDIVVRSLHVVKILLPLSVPKANFETVMECFCETLHIFAESEAAHEPGRWHPSSSAEELASMLIDAFENIFLEHTNKKKVYTTFVEKTLADWVHCQSLATPTPNFIRRVQQVGSSILFTPEALRIQLPSSGGSLEPSSLASTSFLDDLIKVSETAPKEVLNALHAFLRAFVAGVRKHRTILFPQGQGGVSRIAPQTQVKQAGMGFLSSCFELIDKSSNQSPLAVSRWTSRLKLLTVVEEESLFHNNDVLGREILLSQGLKAVGVLNHKDEALNDLAVQVLSALTRLDYDLVSSLVPSILSGIAMLPYGNHRSSVEFLRLQLAFHSKTRTLDTLIHSIILTLTSTPIISDSYVTISKGPLLSLQYRDELSAAIFAFLTPSQTPAALNDILGALTSSFKSFEAASVSSSASLASESTRKRRKISAAQSRIVSPELTEPAIRVALLARFSETIIPSLPVRSLSLEVLDGMSSRVTLSRSEVMFPPIQTLLSEALVDISINSLDAQLVAASMLRLMYALQRENMLWKADGNGLGEGQLIENGSKAALIMESRNVLPDLVIELARITLQHYSQLPVKILIPSDQFFTVLLGRLEVSASEIQNVSWSGSVADLNLSSEGQGAALVALWDLVLDRWLPIIDAFAGSTGLDRLVELLFRFDAVTVGNQSDGDFGGITLQSVLQRALTSAVFWELANIRTAVLAVIERRSSILKDYDISGALSSLQQSRSNSPNISPAGLREALEALCLMLLMPAGYHSRSSRIELIRRVLSADIALSLLAVKEDPSPSRKKGNTKNPHSDLASVYTLQMRTILLRMAQQTGSIDILYLNAPFLMYLSSFDALGGTNRDLVIQTTLNLLEIAYQDVVRTALKGEHEAVRILLNDFRGRQDSASSGADRLVDVQSELLFLRILSENITISQLAPELLDGCMKLCSSLSESLKPSLDQLITANAFSGDSAKLLYDWRTFRRVKRWLQSSDRNTFVGMPLARTLLAARHRAGSRLSIPFDSILPPLFAVIVEELSDVAAQERLSHIESAISCSVAFSAVVDVSAFDSSLAQFSRSMTSEEYAFALDSVHSFISAGTRPAAELITMVNISDIFIRHAPEGSFKTTQRHVTRCLQALDYADYTDSNLLGNGLAFILNQCGDRSSFLRTADIGCISGILAKALSRASIHEDHTFHDVYQRIVSIAMALIRLRRDLVVAVLPHLSIILCRLLEVQGSVRPDLGARQRRSVTDSLPRWINPDQPLGPEDAKATARLLNSILTKTVVRNNSQNDAASKVQSLAQPFSKHAPYVLSAYLRALGNPFTMYSSAVRQELETGLFALCDMMGEHGRDSIMMSVLDSGGQILLKMLWKQYEKQRYVGQG